MKSSEIRQQFLDYFASKGHAIVPSSSLVPHDDPTLLFTNAGMNQFKDVFLGFDKRPYTRAASSQRCVRAGGKHNDLENVGYTARHHTFFEMLGNFSFGDYFKQNAIEYAWEFLTEVLKLPKDKLYVTVYAEDDEAYEIWTQNIGLEDKRVIRIGDNKGARYASDNFWMMGDTGPCGPCSEIFYDHGPEIRGGLPGTPEEDGDRYIEIWNNVFMQFNRDEHGVMHPLPKPSVDTGMGLERLSAVMQHVHSNYEIDLFQALIKAAAREVYCVYHNQTYQVASVEELCAKHPEALTSPSLRVLADHIRACAFLITDGVIPGNDGRGYVLRRIIRRAIRHGYKLGARAAFFYRLVPDLVGQMGAAYPELAQAQSRVMEVLRQEEERFFQTIESGMHILDSAISMEYFALQWLEKKTNWKFQYFQVAGFSGKPYAFDGIFIVNGKEIPVEVMSSVSLDQPKLDRLYKTVYDLKGKNAGDYKEISLVVIKGSANEAIPASIQSLIAGAEFPIELFEVPIDELKPLMVLRGDVAFKLHDTYGFPLDLTQDVCREHGVNVDVAGFDEAMAHQKEQARAAGKFKMAAALDYSGVPTAFRGYEILETKDATITALYVDGSPVNQITAGQAGVVVLDQTPFYAESGGQVGDAGELELGSVCTTLFTVDDTHKIQADVFGHQGVLRSGALQVGDTVVARVDALRRARTMRNHSATHLMHKALREVLGAHVQQKGSQVDPDKTRFDFAHTQPMTDAEIRRVEDIVNAEILANAETQARVMSIDDAQKTGAMMLFGEKYGDEVRVLDIGSSRELCGGTHVKRTGDIGLFKIVAESGVAAGVRRVEAVTGEGALALVQQQEEQLRHVAHAVKAQPAEAAARIGQVLDHVKALEKELAALKSKVASAQGDELVAQAQDVKGVKVLAAKLEGADVTTLRETMDKLKDKLKSAAIVLASSSEGKVSLIAGVTADQTGKVKAGELVNFVAQQVGGKGGGRPDMAQAGGTQPENLAKALSGVPDWVRAKL